MDALFHSREEIERALVYLHCVPTDNREALLALGFEPMCPQVTQGYERRLWVRSIDSGYGSSLSNGRKLVLQLAYLEERDTKVTSIWVKSAAIATAGQAVREKSANRDAISSSGNAVPSKTERLKLNSSTPASERTRLRG